MDHQNTRIPLTWAPEGERSIGRPKGTWRKLSQERGTQKMGFATWNEIVTIARDRADWKRQVNGPIHPEES